MRIAILGAGPAGLYLAYLIKRRDPAVDLTVIEQNPANATFGFGVVFSDRALEFLREDDGETYAAITPHMESWHDMTLNLRGQRIVIDGIGFRRHRPPASVASVAGTRGVGRCCAGL